MLLVYPRWTKLERQTEFHLPPHGPVVFAATLPDDVGVTFVDENREPLDMEASPDILAVSVMLTCQLPRAFEIADAFRARGITVIFGGIATMLHAEEVEEHADAVFLGEAEGYIEHLLDDFRKGRLRSVYDHMAEPPPIESVGTARRDILDYDHYSYGGVRMVDLVHASRGCRFACFPCCVKYLGGRKFRPRPFDAVVEEISSIDNERLFLVDNSLAQSTSWELGLFEAIEPLGIRWVSHPIEHKPEVVEAAARAGCWYVYQAIVDTSDHIRERIKLYHDHGIGVEGTILLGLDDQDEDGIRRMVEFLLECKLDMAEFTVLTPFPHTRIRDDLESEGRILSNDWGLYTADKVVYQPRHMSPERLQELYYWAWDTFYAEEPQRFRMYKLLERVIKRPTRTRA